MKIILEQKRKLVKDIRNSANFKDKLTFSDKGIYGSIIKRKNELLVEMIHIKGWSFSEESSNLQNNELLNDYDIYDNNRIINIS